MRSSRPPVHDGEFVAPSLVTTAYPAAAPRPGNTRPRWIQPVTPDPFDAEVARALAEVRAELGTHNTKKIRIPSLKTRTKELPRIIDEYGADAVAELRVRQMGPREARFTEADRAWVIDSTSRTLPEIEKATRRLVALRMSEDLHRAVRSSGWRPCRCRGGSVAGSYRRCSNDPSLHRPRTQRATLADLKTHRETRDYHHDRCDTIQAKGAVNGSLRTRIEALDPIPRRERRMA